MKTLTAVTPRGTFHRTSKHAYTHVVVVGGGYTAWALQQPSLAADNRPP